MQTHKKILVLVESLDVNDSSGSKGRVALLQNLVRAGFDITALHYTQQHIVLEDIDAVAVKEGKSFYYFLSTRAPPRGPRFYISSILFMEKKIP